jgi:chromosome segregation ATPase
MMTGGSNGFWAKKDNPYSEGSPEQPQIGSAGTRTVNALAYDNSRSAFGESIQVTNGRMIEDRKDGAGIGLGSAGPEASTRTIANAPVRTDIETTQSAKSALQGIRNVTAELEKRRAELLSLARAAENRAREAEEKHQQAEARLEQEIAQRMLFEKQLSELEQEHLQMLQAGEAESLKFLKAMMSHEEAETRLQEVEGRLKSAEEKAAALESGFAVESKKRVEAENSARMIEERYATLKADLSEEVELRLQATQQLRDLEDKYNRTEQSCEIAELKLYDAVTTQKEYEDKHRELEERLVATEQRLKGEQDARRAIEEDARDARKKDAALQQAVAEAERLSSALSIANQKRMEAETAARASEERLEKLEARFVEMEAIVVDSRDRCKLLEGQLRQESSDRTAAESKLKIIEEELSSYLEMDWSKGEPDGAMLGLIGTASSVGSDAASLLQSRLDSEQKARIEAEDAFAALELKLWDMEWALRNAEEKTRQQEEEVARLLQKKESAAQPDSDEVVADEGNSAGEDFFKSTDENLPYKLSKRDWMMFKIRFAAFGVGIGLLLIFICMLIAAAFMHG